MSSVKVLQSSQSKLSSQIIHFPSEQAPSHSSNNCGETPDVQKEFTVPGFEQVEVWKFLKTLSFEQNSSPTNPFSPQSRLDLQFIGVFWHWLDTVPGFMHSSKVREFKSLHSELL